MLAKLQERWYFLLVLMDAAIASTLPVMLLEGDATATVFMAMIAVPTFFAKENWIYQKERRGCGSYTL